VAVTVVTLAVEVAATGPRHTAPEVVTVAVACQWAATAAVVTEPVAATVELGARGAPARQVPGPLIEVHTRLVDQFFL